MYRKKGMERIQGLSRRLCLRASSRDAVFKTEEEFHSPSAIHQPTAFIDPFDTSYYKILDLTL